MGRRPTTYLFHMLACTHGHCLVTGSTVVGRRIFLRVAPKNSSIKNITFYKLYLAGETYAHENFARKNHARENLARENHAHESHARENHACKNHAMRIVPQKFGKIIVWKTVGNVLYEVHLTTYGGYHQTVGQANCWHRPTCANWTQDKTPLAIIKEVDNAS